MDIRRKISAEQIYRISFLAAIVLLPWSIRWCSYALVVMVVAGLLSSEWNEKARRLRQQSQVWIFIGFYGFYVAGMIYTQNFSEGLFSLEQKLALLVIPVIVATSTPLTDQQRKLTLLCFVCSNALLIVVSLIVNIYSVGWGGPPAQINFDFHTLASFNALHPNANPAWLQFSYIGFTNSIISPVYLSLYLTLCTLVLFYSTPRTLTLKVLKYTGVIGFSVVVLLLASRAGIFIFLIVALFNLSRYLLRKNFSIAQTSIISFGLVAIMALLIMQFPVTRFRLIDEVLSTPSVFPSTPEKWNSINLRYLEWKAGLEGIKTNRILGTGTGGTTSALKPYYDQVDLGDFELDYNTHNQYLETYLEIGLAGFVFLMLCFIGPLTLAVRSRDKLLFSLVLMVALSCLSECVLERFKGLVFYISFLSLFMFSKGGGT
jgi:O-antigen ligase